MDAAECSHHDDDDTLLFCFDLLQDLQSITVTQFQIKQHDFNFFLPNCIQRVIRRVCLKHTKLIFQGEQQRRADCWFIIDNKQLTHSVKHLHSLTKDKPNHGAAIRCTIQLYFHTITPCQLIADK